MIFKNYVELTDHIISKAKKTPFAIVCADESHTMEAVIESYQKQLILPVFIGDKKSITEYLTANGLNASDFEIIDETDPTRAAQTAVSLVHDGSVRGIMKGKLDTSQLMKVLLKSENKLRTSSVGHVIRSLHIDELPQLFNILKGDMAFVGPRPERPEIAELYKKSIPEFDFRLKMKAGLTGYAQVFGKYSTTPYDKLKLDLTYIENYTFALDLMIIIQTVKILFQKENSEGLDTGQKTALRTEDKKN